MRKEKAMFKGGVAVGLFVLPALFLCAAAIRAEGESASEIVHRA